MLQLPLWAFPVNWGAMMHPELATPGTRVINQFSLGQALTGELDGPPVNAFMVYNSNPLIVCPDQDKMVAGLSREDLFTVVSDHFLTDTAQYADIVLPATTQLEQKDIMFSWGHLYVALNTPAIEPLGEAVSNTELVPPARREDGIHRPLLHPHRRRDARGGLRLVRARDGRAITLESLAAVGLVAAQPARAPMSSQPHADGNFPTPSGKTEFRSSVAEAAGNFVVPLFRQGYEGFQPGGVVDPLPLLHSRRARPSTAATR